MVACFLILFLVNLGEATIPSVAVIGGGIGGSTTSYFLNQLFDGNINITLFEKSEIGGRLRQLDIGGESYDSGGSVIHSSNLYAKTLSEKVGLKAAPDAGDTSVGLYNTTGFLLKLAGGNSDIGTLFWRYGMGLGTLKARTENINNKFIKIYCLQSNKAAFKSVPDLLSSIDPELLKSAQRTFRSELLKEKISDKIQYELVTAAIRANYNQELKVNAFLGYVAVAGGMSGKLWRIDGGNYQLPKKVLDKSKASIVKSKVTKVLKSGEKYSVTFERGEKEVSELYDIVVIATPLHDASIMFDVDVKELMAPYQTTIATFVNGVLAPLDGPKDNPSDILTVANKKLPFSSIGLKGKAAKDFNYKVFSKKKLTKTQLSKLFSTIHEVKVVEWKAYPKYTEKSPLPSFEISPGLYSVNAIELAASAIEMSCIGARNVALLAYHYLHNSSVDITKICKEKKIDLNKYKTEL